VSCSNGKKEKGSKEETVKTLFLGTVPPIE
jgi:hypothetical protein